MLIRTFSASSIVAVATLIAAQGGLAQETTDPAPASTANAQPAPAQAPQAPAQPGTTSIPPSDPAIPPQASAPPADPAPQTAEPAQDPPASPGASASAPTEQAEAPPAAAANPQVAAFVDSQFPALDTDADGALTTAQFEDWIGKLKAAELQAAGKPVNDSEVKTYAQNAFLNADRDADKKVTKAEATQFFSGSG